MGRARPRVFPKVKAMGSTPYFIYPSQGSDRSWRVVAGGVADDHACGRSGPLVHARGAGPGRTAHAAGGTPERAGSEMTTQ